MSGGVTCPVGAAQVFRVAMQASAAFLNNSSSRWEAIWDAWEFKAELVDHVSPIYRSDFLRCAFLSQHPHVSLRVGPAIIIATASGMVLCVPPKPLQKSCCGVSTCSSGCLPPSALALDLDMWVMRKCNRPGLAADMHSHPNAEPWATGSRCTFACASQAKADHVQCTWPQPCLHALQELKACIAQSSGPEAQ